MDFSEKEIKNEKSIEKPRKTFTDYSKKLIQRLNLKCLKKVNKKMNLKKKGKRFTDLKQISKKWVKKIIAEKKIEKNLIRRSKTLTFEFLDKMQGNFLNAKTKSLEKEVINFNLKIKKSITKSLPKMFP